MKVDIAHVGKETDSQVNPSDQHVACCGVMLMVEEAEEEYGKEEKAEVIWGENPY